MKKQQDNRGLTPQDLYLAMRLHRKVFFHRTFLSFAYAVGDGYRYTTKPIKITNIHEDKRHPNIRGIGYRQGDLESFMPITIEGNFPTADAVPVFSFCSPPGESTHV